MAIDITQLAKQFQSPRQAKGGARSAIQSVLEEQERWRKGNPPVFSGRQKWS